MDDLPPSYITVRPPSYKSTLPPSYSKFLHNGPAPEEDEDDVPTQLTYNPPQLMFEDVYEACVQYSKSHCCYGSTFLNEMKLIDVINKAVNYYTLESFSETRKTYNNETPYRVADPVDGIDNGIAPDPLEMEVIPPDLFSDCSARIDIPHTDRVNRCSKCIGSGEINCKSCEGRGYDNSCECLRITIDICGLVCCCNAEPFRCWTCTGTGKVRCKECKSCGRIKKNLVLLVNWTNLSSEYISDAGNIPNHVIRKAVGTRLLKQKGIVLEPLTNAPDPLLVTASERMFEEHKLKLQNTHIIRQRHILQAIPYTRVTYQWQGRDGEFYVYGNDRKVYFENYPQQWCSCIVS